MREALAFLLLACACGVAWSGRPSGPAGGAKKGEVEANETDGLADHRGSRAGDADGSAFAALEQRAPALAPGMRMAAERENGGERAELVRAVDRDACVRVAFEASTPVTARLVDLEGVTLAESRSAAKAGELGERGPVCVRKGDSISAVAVSGDGGAGESGSSARVRWIAWALP